MIILKLDSGKKPMEMKIQGNLKEMQGIVGGNIEAIYPFSDPVALICNEDGKLLHLPPNRALQHPDTQAVYDIVCGTCFLCGAPLDSDSFTSLTSEQIARYTQYFERPDLFLRTESGVVVIKM